MDPFNALSIATATLQFIDFGAELVHTAKEIYTTGSSVTVEHLRKLNDDLKLISHGLQRASNNTSTANADEQALSQMSRDCYNLSSDLTTTLDKIIKTSPKATKWDSVISALKTMWRKDKIEDVEWKLGHYRQHIMLRILVLLNTHRSLQEEKIDALHAKGDEIIEVVALNFEKLRNELADQSLRNELNVNGRSQYDHVQAAILTTRLGQCVTITDPTYSRFNSIYQDGSTCYQRSTVFRQSSDLQDNSAPGLHLDDLLENNRSQCMAAAQYVLRQLYFQQMRERYINIAPAHIQTFKWVFDTSEIHGESWDDIVIWLKYGNGCYWVSGKAGSGKSTFMKFLQRDQRTTEALSVWAEGSRLLMSSFYFWYAGTPLQKTQEGLLRALLHEILSKLPELAITLFPDLYRRFLLDLDHSSHNKSMTRGELLRAFQILVANVPSGVKICVFIDGLDEYVGDHNDICQILLEAAKYDNFKILVSSRPIPSCVSAFAGCLQLGLHQLTHRDIQRYVTDELCNHSLLIRMNSAQPWVATKLLDIIEWKACGVFLWVVLVVRMIIVGLQDYDNYDELIQRVNELPPDLERLYDHMLGSMSDRHRVEGSKILQLVLRSMYTHGQFPMTLLQFSFAQDDACGQSIPSYMAPLTKDQLDWRLESAEGRIRSRCCGLVEVGGHLTTPGNQTTREVRFLHRSVVEFLQTGPIWIK